MTLHDLIEDMDKEIVRRESATEPAEQSRLWSREDIKKVLQENKVSKINTLNGLIFIFKCELSLLIITCSCRKYFLLYNMYISLNRHVKVPMYIHVLWLIHYLKRQVYSVHFIDIVL